MDPDGRVVRRDQGNDTEGQAYAMLVAVALGPGHLRPGLNVDAAAPEAARRDAELALDERGCRRRRVDGSTLGTSILAVETATTTLGRVLVAGSWATEKPYAFNPSYTSPAAVDVLASASTNSRWAELAEGSRAATTAVLPSTDLPPD